MSEIKLTNEQFEAINIRNKNIIVSAQAGAGKTHILVDRIVTLLEEEEISINDMLIVTFTNKAAAEMKSRIKRVLQDKVSSTSFNKKLFFQKEYNKTTNAQISTMHAFCINVLRDYFYKLGLNPGFKILTNSSLDIIKWKSINDVFTRYYKNKDEDFYRLLDIYTTKYNDDRLKAMLLYIYNFINSQVDPFEWLDEQIEEYKYKEYYEKEEHLNELKNDFYNLYREELDKILYEYKEISLELSDIYNKGECLAYKNTYIDDLNIVNKFFDVDSFEKLKDLENIKFSRASKGAKKDNSECGDSLDYIKELVYSYRDSFKKFISTLRLDIEKEINSQDEIKKSLVFISKLLKDYDKEFKNNKTKRQAIDFSDVEHLTIKLLEDEEVANEIRNRFKYIFFDEYQDSNKVQNYIVNKISRENNLFFVGDIKQSIYKFRLADPIIFKNRYELYKKNSDINKVIDLKHNFRSERVLLKFNNMIFNNIMTEEVGDVKYDDESHRLQPGLSKYEDNKSLVSLNYIYEDKDSYEELDISKEIFRANPEAFYIAKKIKTLIDEGESYKDIVVLSRTASMISEISEYLELFNIPYYSDSSKYSYDDIELKVFIEILKAINDDTDDVTLLSAITSTLANISDEELAIIRGDNSNNSFGYCFRNFEKSNNARLEGADSIVKKINSYNEKINSYRRLEKTMSISDLAWYVLVDSGHLSYILSKNNGKKILDNITLFIDEIKEFETSTYQSLSSFLDYVERMLDKKLSEREAGAELSEEDNVVRLMTIHKSKGLQFKNVFVVNLKKKFNMMDLRSSVILNDKFGISLKVYNEEENKDETSLKFENIINEKKRELYSEEMRILYVALTRAKSRIYFVSLSKSEDINVKARNIYSMDNYHDWIYSVLLNEKKIKDILINLEYENIIKKIEYNGINFEFSKVKTSSLLKELNSLSSEEIKSEFEILKVKSSDINNIFNFKYDNSKVGVPYKQTVTEISSKDDNISSDFKEFNKIIKETGKIMTLAKKPKFIEQNTNYLDALDKGSLYHFIFEKMPNNINNNNDIIEYLNYLLVKSYISKKEYNSIDISVLKKYIESELYMRLKKSNRVENERSFTMFINDNGNDILVDGQIDLFFEEDGEIVIVDFKTNKEIDLEIYKKQLELYKLGLSKATGMKVKEKLIYWVMHGATTIID